jgi:hypothetical protein
MMAVSRGLIVLTSCFALALCTRAFAGCSEEQMEKMTTAGFSQHEIAQICDKSFSSRETQSKPSASDIPELSGGYFVTFTETYDSSRTEELEEMKRMLHQYYEINDMWGVREMKRMIDEYFRENRDHSDVSEKEYWDISQKGNSISILVSPGPDSAKKTKLEIVKFIVQARSLKMRYRTKTQMHDGAVRINTTSLVLDPTLESELEGSYSGPYETVTKIYGRTDRLIPSVHRGTILFVPDLSGSTPTQQPVERNRALDF